MNRPSATPRSFSADQLHSALGDVGGPARPDYLTDIVAQAGYTRQRPGWTFPERWLSNHTARGRQALRTAVLSAAVVLLALLAAVGVYFGSRPAPPVDLGIFEPLAGRIVLGGLDGFWGIDPTSSESSTIAVVTAPPGIPLGWSSDGTRLLVQKGDGNLSVLHADGSETQVTGQLSGNDEIPGSPRPAGATISPDGSRVVFAGQTKPPESDCHDGAIFAVDADGGPAELLWESQRDGIVKYPSFSPDGTRIAVADGYCDSDHSVWVMNADGSDAHRIISLTDALHVHGLEWSPAGDRIALEFEGFEFEGRSFESRIYTFATDGSDFRHIADGTSPHWSPDGSHIAYRSGTLVIAEADGSNAQKFNYGSSGPWHPGTLSPSVEPTVAPAPPEPSASPAGPASPPASPAVNLEPQGEWVATGAVVRRRTEGHSVTLLGDGRVLVAGGGRALESAELYDPSTGLWTPTEDMLAARYRHTATVLPDGRVLVAGGGSSFAIEETLASAEVYDPRTGSWTAAAGMTAARQGHTATLLPDGRVLVAGGQQWVPDNGGGQTVDLASAELYDPVTGSWTATTGMPVPRDVSTATLLPDGRVLFVGASAQLYDPATASWTLTGSTALRHGGHTATLLPDGKVLLVGSGFPLQPGAELYDPRANSWTRTGDMIEDRAWFASGLLPDGRVLVTGSGDGGYGGSPTAETYDPDTGTWTLTPNMLSEHGYHEGVTLNDGRFLVVGGFPAGGVSAETYAVRTNP